MNEQTKKRLWMSAYFAAGSAIGIYLIYVLVKDFGSTAGMDSIVRTLPAALLLIAYFPVPLWAATQSWRLLFPPGEGPARRPSLELTWIGLSVNWLLPVALIGGELVRFRLALRRVKRAEELAASLVGDKTIQVATQALYALFGVSVLAWAGEEIAGDLRDAIGFALFCLAVYLFYRLQRAGLFAGAARRLRALAPGRENMELTGGRIDAAIDHMYGRPARWWGAVAWRITFRLLMAAEVAVVLWWLGQPAAFVKVVALESIAQASRVAALVIPAAIGAQETAIVAAGLVLGYPAQVLIALAVAKRCRELVIGGMGLIDWQIHEARLMWKRRRESAGNPD